MRRYKAIGIAQYTDQPKKRIIRRFYAENDEKAMHYIINNFDCSYKWQYTEIE